MSVVPSLALIVSTFNQPDYLARVLKALDRQRLPASEVILADDGSTDDTGRFFRDWSEPQSFRCEHVWQAHEGFRKARMLNEAIARSRSEYLVFLDGDTLPHPMFLSDHCRLARRRAFVQGHRALVQRRAAATFGLGEFNRDRRSALWRGQLRGLKGVYRWPHPWRRWREDLRGVRGCNFGVWRADIGAINGFNEEFKGWGREDSELTLRLMNSGVRRLDVRGWALCYHLWHPPASREALRDNDKLLEVAIARNAVTCAHGLAEHLSGAPQADSEAHYKD